MRVRLDQVQQEPHTWQEEVELSSTVEAEQVGLSSLSCRGAVSCTSDGYLLEARLRYSQTLSCYRCLDPTRQELDYDFRILVVRSAKEEPSEQELEEQDLDVLRIDGDELDTLPLLREQVLLNFPMKPLCSQACQGLCVECGVNLNRESCSCRRSPADPRWQGLVGLRERLRGGSEDSVAETGARADDHPGD